MPLLLSATAEQRTYQKSARRLTLLLQPSVSLNLSKVIGSSLVPSLSMSESTTFLIHQKSGQRLVGDVDYNSVAPVASKITPVPGGVGPMTVAMLIKNVLDSAKRHYAKESHRSIKPLPLDLKSPVPSDIDISRAQTPKSVRSVAQEIGLTEHEFEPYGAYKGKVSLEVLERLEEKRNGKYVLVAGITPTLLAKANLLLLWVLFRPLVLTSTKWPLLLFVNLPWVLHSVSRVELPEVVMPR